MAIDSGGGLLNQASMACQSDLWPASTSAGLASCATVGRRDADSVDSLHHHLRIHADFQRGILVPRGHGFHLPIGALESAGRPSRKAAWMDYPQFPARSGCNPLAPLYGRSPRVNVRGNCNLGSPITATNDGEVPHHRRICRGSCRGRLLFLQLAIYWRCAIVAVCSVERSKRNSGSYG